MDQDLRRTCQSRKCCWTDSPNMGGPNCAFPHNYGFRTLKVKENSFTSKWLELTRINSPKSYANSNVPVLEAKVEMQTDSRMRLRVILDFN